MKTIELSPGTENRLLAISHKLGRSEVDLIEEAVLSFLEEFEDYQEAKFRLNNPSGEYLTLEEVQQEIDLAD